MSTIELSTRSSLWRVIFVPSISWESYVCAGHLTLQSLSSYFRANHITLHPSILLASYFCTVQPLGELFSCLLFDSLFFGELFSCWHLTLHPSIPLASYFCTVQPLGELFSCLLFDSPFFGELFSCWPFMHLSIVSTRVQMASNPWEIDRLLLPEGRTSDENVFSQGGKIEHPRADLHLASFIKWMLLQFHCEWNMSSGEAC